MPTYFINLLASFSTNLNNNHKVGLKLYLASLVSAAFFLRDIVPVIHTLVDIKPLEKNSLSKVSMGASFQGKCIDYSMITGKEVEKNTVLPLSIKPSLLNNCIDNAMITSTACVLALNVLKLISLLKEKSTIQYCFVFFIMMTSMDYYYAKKSLASRKETLINPHVPDAAEHIDGSSSEYIEPNSMPTPLKSGCDRA